MAILKILTYPDPFLRRKAQPVNAIDGEILHIIDDMAETMYDAPGAGLAAVQVGIDKSIVVYDVAQKNGERSLQVLVNPVIISREGEMISENEGCLSVLDFRADVKRAACVCVEALDREGASQRIEGTALHAIALQHEIDHLNGILFIDHLSSLKREMYKRRIKKQQRKNG